MVAINRAFQSFEDLFGALAKTLGSQDGFRKVWQLLKQKALDSKKALTPEAAEELVASFWIEMLWHKGKPLLQPAPDRRKDIRNQLATLLIKMLKATKLAGHTGIEPSPLVAFLAWKRDCLIAEGEAEAFDAHLQGAVRVEIAASLQDSKTGQKQQVLFREGHSTQMAHAANVAFYPFLSRLIQKYDALKVEKDSTEHALSPTDQSRLKGWIQMLPEYLKAVDKTWLVRLMNVLAQEVLKALPDGSADSVVLAKDRKQLLLRCLQAAFLRGSSVLNLQGSPLVQSRNHGLGRLFCSTVVATIFNSAALIAAKEDPTKLLGKKFAVEQFDDAMAVARAAAEAMAVDIALLADAALDAAKAKSV